MIVNTVALQFIIYSRKNCAFEKEQANLSERSACLKIIGSLCRKNVGTLLRPGKKTNMCLVV